MSLAFQRGIFGRLPQTRPQPVRQNVRQRPDKHPRISVNARTRPTLCSRSYSQCSVPEATSGSPSLPRFEESPGKDGTRNIGSEPAVAGSAFAFLPAFRGRASSRRFLRAPPAPASAKTAPACSSRHRTEPGPPPPYSVENILCRFRYIRFSTPNRLGASPPPRIHVRAIHIEQRTLRMKHIAILSSRPRNTPRTSGIGEHQRRGVLIHLCGQRRGVEIPRVVRFHI